MKYVLAFLLSLVSYGSPKLHIDLVDQQSVFSENVAKLIEFVERKGYKVTLGEAYRTHEQALIYSHTGLGIVNSLHCQRLAIDLNVFTKEEKRLVSAQDYLQFGEYWEKLDMHNIWGGRWLHRPDADHFQMDEAR